MSLSLIVITIISVCILAMNALLFFMLKKKGDQKPDEQNLLHQRLDSVTKIILDELKENRSSVTQSSQAVNQQVQGFTSGLTQLKESVKTVHESMKDVLSFQDIFRSPKLRGQWGETSLEAALSAHFPKELYAIQHYFKSGEAVDAVLRLPNNLVLPIDSKFNWENFEKMIHADSGMAKEGFRKMFLSDVKKKIDEISSKYILPSEGTADLALMYIPAEAIYYDIIHDTKEADIPDYARKKKIILVSPNTFFLTLSAIHHWFRDVHITKQTQEIIRRLAQIKQDSEKLGESFRKLGKHITDTQSAYESSDKRLGLLSGKVQKIITIKGEEFSDNSSENSGKAVLEKEESA